MLGSCEIALVRDDRKVVLYHPDGTHELLFTSRRHVEIVSVTGAVDDWWYVGSRDTKTQVESVLGHVVDGADHRVTLPAGTTIGATASTRHRLYAVTEPSGSAPAVLLQVDDSGDVAHVCELPGAPVAMAARGEDVVVAEGELGGQDVVVVHDGVVTRTRALSGDASVTGAAIDGDRVMVGRNMLEAGGAPTGVDIELSEDGGRTWVSTTDRGGYLGRLALSHGHAYADWHRPGKKGRWWVTQRGERWHVTPGTPRTDAARGFRLVGGVLWFSRWRAPGPGLALRWATI